MCITHSMPPGTSALCRKMRMALIVERLWCLYAAPSCLQEMEATGELYFASARQFQDPFEGAVAVLPPGLPVHLRYTERDGTENAFEELRRLTKICCWHRAAYESDAMWQLYAGKWKGVANCVRVSSMLGSPRYL